MKLSLTAVLFALSLVSFADSPKQPLSIGGFVDSYYGFDFNEPSGDRSFTTQAARHNEFSINLAYVDLKLDKERTRGRLALQAGTSVYANYSGDRSSNPALGNITQHLQEAYGGYRLSDGLWLDAGIFLSHIGAESFISKDNWNYTRSLGAEYSPYYQTGVRVSYQWNPKWLTSLHVMNGWQNTIETNSDKALGMQISYSPSDDFSVTYNNFLGREQEIRFFNNFVFKAKLTDKWQLCFSSDVGFQKRSGDGYSVWYVETILTQYRLSETVALGGRLEYFNDRDQVVVTTGTANGFQTTGASLNVDWQPDATFLLRNEIRYLFSRESVFSSKSGQRSSNTLFVTSVGVSF